MLLYHRSKDRPFHLGSYPLEVLPRDAAIIATEAQRPPALDESGQAPPVTGNVTPLAGAVRRYAAIFADFDDAAPAPGFAPVPEDLLRRSMDVKGAAYFMDAGQVGICEIPANAWLTGVSTLQHQQAIVILVAHPRYPEPDNLASAWSEHQAGPVTAMRAGEIAAIVAGHVRNMGFPARAHFKGSSRLDLDRLAVLAGLGVRSSGAVQNPYLGQAFEISAVSTEYTLAVDLPLAADALDYNKAAYWLGINGATSGREWKRREKRATHLSRYPMETVKRVDRPTTLILDDEVPRVPKRAAFFERALQGDLGQKSKAQRTRFATKHPMSRGQSAIIRAMVPYQNGPVAEADDAARAKYADPAANARAIKSLSYFLGSDLTGICEIPRYAWNSHHVGGEAIEPYHRYAIVMLIDQGYDTMEGASGDDWISGAQSMRGYLRGAEIAGILAETLRVLGFSARSQTNADSDLQHIPLILWAGLGELSRIGELVLNPFVGPRFKSVITTTNLPLATDKPIDFGLQYFCSHCYKCARECPCDAIPYGGKVMFNGYEMWKPDVERCTRYRVTNPKGSACGRCMKTCPLNKVVDTDGALVTQAASWLGVNAMWLKPLMVPIAPSLDDKQGNGKRNLVKKWWFDHEMVDGVATTPHSSNEREIDPTKSFDAARQKIAYYPADAMPPPDAQTPVMVERKAALAVAEKLESPGDAAARAARGAPAPAHYRPTPGSNRE